MNNDKIWSNIWNTIHIFGKTYDVDSNPTNTDAFKCFFECLISLLPDKFEAEGIQHFMRENPLNYNVLQRNEFTFKWTVDLHNYINYLYNKKGYRRSYLSIEQMKKEYSVITKTDWGRSTWFLIHYLASNINDFPSDTQKTAYKAFIVCLQYLIPCSECRNHFTLYISENNLDPFIHTKNNLFYWTWKFHNEVNRRINKPELDFQTAFQMYRRDEGHKKKTYQIIDELDDYQFL